MFKICRYMCYPAGHWFYTAVAVKQDRGLGGCIGGSILVDVIGYDGRSEGDNGGGLSEVILRGIGVFVKLDRQYIAATPCLEGISATGRGLYGECCGGNVVRFGFGAGLDVSSGLGFGSAGPVVCNLSVAC